MNSTIEDLYYGNLSLSERSFHRGSEYARILKNVTQSEERLIGLLDETQKVAFEKFRENNTDLNLRNEVSAFTIGFKLGLKLTAETFISDGID